MPTAKHAQRDNVLAAATRSGWRHEKASFDSGQIIRDLFMSEIGTIRAVWLLTPWSGTGRWAGAIFSDARNHTEHNVWKITGTGGLLELLADAPVRGR